MHTHCKRQTVILTPWIKMCVHAAAAVAPSHTDSRERSLFANSKNVHNNNVCTPRKKRHELFRNEQKRQSES